MSILIKGMEMPEKGHILSVVIKDGKVIGANTGKVLSKEVIELPPHGDLIDRDALMRDGWLCLHKEVMRMGGYAIHELPLKNPSIPVVIEKENC